MSAATFGDFFVRQFWQVSVVILICAAIAPLVGRRRPHLAYLLWLIVAAKCVIPPTFNSHVGVFSWAQMDRTTVTQPAPQSASIPMSLPTETLHRPSQLKIGSVVDPTIAKVTRSSRTPFTWTTGLLFAWAIGAFSYAMHLAMHWLRTQRMIAEASPAAGSLAALYHGICVEHEINRAPTLVVVDTAFGPAAVGCMWPQIVLPRRLLACATESELKSILVHELSHVRRGDVWMSWIQVVASCVWWFHPLVWHMNRQIVRWREASCDEEVIAWLAIGPREYADAILRVVESHVKPIPAMQIGMAVGESTEARLRRLMTKRKFCSRTPLWCWLVSATLAMTVLPGAALSVPPTPIAQVQSSDGQVVEQGKQIRPEQQPRFVDGVVVGAGDAIVAASQLQIDGTLQLVQAAGDVTSDNSNPIIEESIVFSGTTIGPQPLTNVELTLVRIRGADTSDPVTTRSDAQGNFRFPPQTFRVNRSNPNPFEKMILQGKTPTGVTMWRSFSIGAVNGRIALNWEMGPWTYFDDNQRAAEANDKIRTTIVNLQFPAETANVGGTVVDHTGRPLRHAKVTLDACVTTEPPYLEAGSSDQDASSVVVGLLVDAPMTRLPESLQLEVSTDDQGKWQLGSFPKELTLQISSTQGNSPQTTARIAATEKPVQLTIADSQSATITVVHELTGERVPHAKVHAEQRQQPNAFPVVLAEAIANEDGQVELRLPVGDNMIVLSPDDVNLQKCYYTSTQMTVDHTVRAKTLKIDSGATIELRVVDDATGDAIPYLPVRPAYGSQLEHYQPHPNARINEGITEFRCRPGSAKFIVPGAGFQGYEIINPMAEPISIGPGDDLKYVFRLRKMKEYRPPVEEDHTVDFPAKHRAAVAKLRELGAIVRSHHSSEGGHCDVHLSQFWRGQPSDLIALADLNYLSAINCTVHPVPKEFRKENTQAPLVTDAWLKHIGSAKELTYLHIARSEITDIGLAQLSGCSQLNSLHITASKLAGHGLTRLQGIPLSDIAFRSPALDLEHVDLSGLKSLRFTTFESEARNPVRPPIVGPDVVHAKVTPVDAESIRRLNTYAGLRDLEIAGSELTDELLRNARCVGKLSNLILGESKITNAGLSALTNSRLDVLSLSGAQFTDAAIPYLKSIQQLKFLKLTGTSLTPNGIAELQQTKPGLQIQVVSQR